MRRRNRRDSYSSVQEPTRGDISNYSDRSVLARQSMVRRTAMFDRARARSRVVRDESRKRYAHMLQLRRVSPVRLRRLRNNGVIVSKKYVAQTPHHTVMEVVGCLHKKLNQYKALMSPGGAGKAIVRKLKRNDSRRQMFQAARKAC